MTSDIIVPDGFKFSIEVKSVKTEIDFFEESAALEKWLHQVSEDAHSIGKMPLLCWKRPHKGWFAIVPSKAFRSYGYYGEYYFRYASNSQRWKGGWIVLRLDELLEANASDHKFWWVDAEAYLTAREERLYQKWQNNS